MKYLSRANRFVSLRDHPLVVQLLLVLILFAGCGQSASSEQKLGEVELENSQLQAKVQSLDSENSQLRAELKENGLTANRWFTLAVVAICGAVIGAILSLVIGTAIGQRAKKDFDHQHGNNKTGDNIGTEGQR